MHTKERNADMPSPPSTNTSGWGRIWERKLRDMLSRVGVAVDGSAPHDIQVHDRRFYRQVLAKGSLGLGDSYVYGWWDAEAVDETINKILVGGLQERAVASPSVVAVALAARVANFQEVRPAERNARWHYEKGLDMYRAMLDPRMTYTCGYWKNASTLAEAQEAKLELICQKLGLYEGSTLLDIGCGWGSLVKYAAERHGVRAKGITVSPEQAQVTREDCHGLPVDIEVVDFRHVQGKFDAIVSVGMFEHVGVKNYGAYMETVDRCLNPDGVKLLHTIAGNRRTPHLDAWLHKHVFPGCTLPTLAEIGEATEGLFVVEDVHNFGPDYDLTLMAWERNFEAAWPELRAQYDERFRRMWRYYLLCSAASFRARRSQLFQVVLSRPGRKQPEGARAG